MTNQINRFVSLASCGAVSHLTTAKAVTTSYEYVFQSLNAMRMGRHIEILHAASAMLNF